MLQTTKFGVFDLLFIGNTVQTKAIVSALCVLSLTGCVAAPIAPPITSGTTRALDVTVRGLQRHSAYQDDLVFMLVYDGDFSREKKPVGRQPLTIEKPSASVLIDAKATYTIVLSSIEANFGGFTSCTVTIPMPAVVSGPKTTSMEYVTRKNSCEVTLSTTDEGAAEPKLVMYRGSLDGVQFSATTLPP